MVMKIVCILGSPRINGNSATIARRFVGTAKSLGAETQIVALNEISFRGCQGCYACKTDLDRCVLEDDLTDVLEAVRTADVIVLATPVYGGHVTGQFKCFMDRTFSYLVPDYITNPQPSRLAPGKKIVFIITQGSPIESTFADIFPRYDERFKRSWRAAETHLIRACGLGPTGGVPDHFTQQAEELARSICV